MNDLQCSDPTSPEQNPPENVPATDPPYEDPANPKSPMVEPGEDVDDGNSQD